MLEVQSLKKIIGPFELRADLRVSRGERAAVIGRSGAGKTSLLRIIAGLNPPGAPDGGKILLAGREITSLPPENRGVGFVFQDHALFPSMSVIENVGFGLRMKGISKTERETRARDWLAKAGLSGRDRARVEMLSGGERQRVALIRALICEPELLLLDEPFSALDSKLKKDLIGHILELHALWPVPLLFVTHEEAELGAFATVRYAFEESDGGQIRTLKKTP